MKLLCYLEGVFVDRRPEYNTGRVSSETFQSLGMGSYVVILMWWFSILKQQYIIYSWLYIDFLFIILINTNRGTKGSECEEDSRFVALNRCVICWQWWKRKVWRMVEAWTLRCKGWSKSINWIQECIDYPSVIIQCYLVISMWFWTLL